MFATHLFIVAKYDKCTLSMHIDEILPAGY